MRNRAGMTPLIVQEIVRHTADHRQCCCSADPEGRRLPPWDPGAHIDPQLITRHDGCTRSAVIRRRNTGTRSPAGSSTRGVRRTTPDNFLKVGRKRCSIRPPRNLFPLSDANLPLFLAAPSRRCSRWPGGWPWFLLLDPRLRGAHAGGHRVRAGSSKPWATARPDPRQCGQSGRTRPDRSPRLT